MTFLSSAILLFLILDPIGNIPCYIPVLKDVDPARRSRIILREAFIALLILVVFQFSGRYLLGVLDISQSSLTIAGGIILFLMALRMIFTHRDGIFGPSVDGEPLIVPLAIPLIAGPSAITTVMVIFNRDPQNWAVWLAALGCAWAASTILLLLSSPLHRILGERVISALEKVMGMVLTVIAVQMFLGGIKEFLAG